MAKAYLECKMYDEAIVAYKKAMTMAQGDWDRKGYMFGLANSYVSAGKYAEALAEYEDIIKISAGRHILSRYGRKIALGCLCKRKYV